VQDADAAAVGPDTPDPSARAPALDAATGEPEREATAPARAPANASNRSDPRAAATTASALGRGPVGASAATGRAAVAGEQQIAAADVASAPAPGAPATAPGFALVETSVSVAEGDGFARVTVRHAGRDEEPVRVFWWTGGHTAEADDDYADLEGVETLAPGASREILVPLADDVWPEDAESFFVYFGLELARRRTQTPAAQAEILVVDDDR
jgi:hypothetical protein